MPGSETGGNGADLEVAAPWRGDYVILSGITSADQLYLYLPGQNRQTVPVVSGKRFLYSFQLSSSQQSVCAELVAVDTGTGGISGQTITIPAQTEAKLVDLTGTWAEADVDALLAQHLISGYPDNTFRPANPITRAEFVVMLAGALGWTDNGGVRYSDLMHFSDGWTIPDWARPAVGTRYNKAWSTATPTIPSGLTLRSPEPKLLCFLTRL